MAKHSFLRRPPPVLTGIFGGQTPPELIAEARHAEFEGAGGLAFDLCGLDPGFRHRDALKPIFDAVNLPSMAILYRNDRHRLDDDARQTVLLAAADAGASMIDVMGDLYDPSPVELTRNPAAVDRQKRLIDQIHAKGAEVVMSSHMSCPRSAEQTLEHLAEAATRGADVVKLVAVADTDEELAEAFRTTMLLKRELKKPFIHLVNGAFGRPHRFLCPALGTAIFFAVPRYEPRYGMGQPTVRAMRTVLDNLHWNILDHV